MANLDIARPRTRRLLVLALLLLSQLLGMAEPHSGHALVASPLEDHGGLILESACHPRDASHLEAAGDGRHEPPCAACLHLVRSFDAGWSGPPRLAPPDAASPLALLPGSLHSAEASSAAAPRGPPDLA